MKTKRVALDALLTAIALVIFVVELLVPLPLPIPGVKLGLSNVVTLFALFACGPMDAFIILVLRIGLGTLFAGNLSALLYSLAGGFLCYFILLILKKIVSKKQIWLCGVFGAIAHNVGQMAVATLLTGTPAILYYLPVLILAATGTGALTGLTAQTIYLRTEKLFSREEREESDKRKK